MVDEIEFPSLFTRKRIIKSILSLTFMILVYYSLYYLINFVSSVEVEISLTLILTGSGLYVASLFIRSLRFQQIVNIEEDGSNLSIKASLAGIFTAWGINAFVPGRLGEFTRLYYSKRYSDITVEETFDSIILEKIFDVSTMAILGLVSFTFLFFRLTNFDNRMRYVAFFLILLSVCLIGLMIILNLSVLIPYFAKIPKIGTFLVKLLSIIQHKSSAIIRNSVGLVKITLYSITIWIIDSCIFIMILYSFQIIPLDVALFSIMLGFLTFIFPILPNAAGQFEGTVGLVFKSLGFSFNLGFKAALLDHLIKSLTGIISLVLTLVITFYVNYTRLGSASGANSGNEGSS